MDWKCLLHSNLDFRLNSQSLAMCLTPEKCLGERAWPNVIPSKTQYEIPLLLWANSTLGLILFWWQAQGSKQDERASPSLSFPNFLCSTTGLDERSDEPMLCDF